MCLLQHSQPASGRRRWSGNPVLIISADQESQDLYVRLLRAERIAAFAVSSGTEAIALSCQLEIGVTLFDVETDDDWKALAAVRRAVAPSAVLVLTGWVRPDGAYRSRTRHLGCAGFLAKPVPPPVLVEAVEEAAFGRPWTEYVRG